MTTLYIRLPVVVDDADPMRCGETCPHTEPVKMHWCDVFGPLHAQWRPERCVEATNAAIDAEIEALHEGWDLASCNGDPQSLRDRVGALRMMEARKVKP